MASETRDQSFIDLSWFLQSITDPQQNLINLQTLSFSSSGKPTHCQLLTDNSMNINVTRENLTSLSQIFIELATSLETHSSLRNLEFEGISWEIELLQSLGLLLDNTSKIKHLAFRKNRFSEQCLSEISDILKRNISIKEIIFSESRIGTRGATLLGSALQVNDSLEELQIWEDSIGSRGAELFKNKSLQSLYVDGNRFGSVGVEDLICPLSRFSALQLQANITLKSLVFGGSKTKIGRDGVTSILRMVETNETVVHLGIHDDTSMGPGDFIQIFNSLQKNASLRRFSVQGCKGVRGDRVLEAITETLQINPLIEEIDLARTPLQDSGLHPSKLFHFVFQGGNQGSYVFAFGFKT